MNERTRKKEGWNERINEIDSPQMVRSTCISASSCSNLVVCDPILSTNATRVMALKTGYRVKADSALRPRTCHTTDTDHCTLIDPPLPPPPPPRPTPANPSVSPHDPDPEPEPRWKPEDPPSQL
ncbi:hypothetical protein D9611_011703 [Ephemerocybe angulata]|uniref:Uncharacterized protein n=1 Tax=Ephemerocybe angulata TaxID=980116 RepID=A0A8H5C586_9AGAR|nr:hypothetical protein D9611_011703 [Tulosesus angulatus]